MAYIVIIRYKYRCKTREEAEKILKDAGDYSDASIIREGVA
jgi:hypothetical protein